MTLNIFYSISLSFFNLIKNDLKITSFSSKIFNFFTGHFWKLFFTQKSPSNQANFAISKSPLPNPVKFTWNSLKNNFKNRNLVLFFLSLRKIELTTCRIRGTLHRFPLYPSLSFHHTQTQKSRSLNTKSEDFAPLHILIKKKKKHVIDLRAHRSRTHVGKSLAKMCKRISQIFKRPFFHAKSYPIVTRGLKKTNSFLESAKKKKKTVILEKRAFDWETLFPHLFFCKMMYLTRLIGVSLKRKCWKKKL